MTVANDIKLDIYRERFKELEDEFNVENLAHYRDIKDYVVPFRGRFRNSGVSHNSGTKKHSYIKDGTGGLALRTLASGMQGGLTSPARPWFKLALHNKELMEIKSVKVWLERVTKLMLAVFNQSNFYTALHSTYYELGAFGTGALYIEEDFEKIIRCRSLTIGEYYVDTDEKQRVNMLYRWIPMRARNVVRKFGKENVSDTVNTWVENNKGGTWVTVIHVVEENEDRDTTKDDSVNKKYLSIYYELNEADETKKLRISGHDDFPYMVPRWLTTGSNVMGTSPGMEALGDIRMLQKMQEKALKALDKIVDPPMNADPSLKGKKLSLVPGGINFTNPITQGAGASFTPTHVPNPNFQTIEYKIERVQNMIERTFYADLFLMLSSISAQKTMTATEVVERHEEKLVALGPVIERLQPELLDGAIDRTFTLMLEAGIVPEPPQEIRGQELKIELTSLLAQAQKSVGLGALENTLGFAGGVAALKPDAIDVLDLDRFIVEHADITGVPTGLVRSIPQILAIRENRAQKEAAATAAANLESMARGTRDLASAKTDEPNALTAIAGGLGG